MMSQTNKIHSSVIPEVDVKVGMPQGAAVPAQKIIGYRNLSQEEINLMNESKILASAVEEFIKKLTLPPGSEDREKAKLVDQRWLAIAKTDLQKGFMSLVRSIAKPETF